MTVKHCFPILAKCLPSHQNTEFENFGMLKACDIQREIPMAQTNLGPISCMDFAAERMSETVCSFMPPSKAEASLRLGVTMSAIGRSCSL